MAELDAGRPLGGEKRIGAPTIVSSGCANGTLTFCALSLMSAEEIGKGFERT